MVTLYLHIIFFSIVFIAIILFRIYLKRKQDKRYKRGKWVLGFTVLLLTYSIYYDLRNKNIHDEFISTACHSKIIDSYEWKGDQFELTLENKIIMFSTSYSFGLHVGDSIVKQANTSWFEVYRKDYTDKYVFYKRFDYDN